MATSGLIATIAIVALGFITTQVTATNRWPGLIFAFAVAAGTLAFLLACWYALRSLGALVNALQKAAGGGEQASRSLMLTFAQRARNMFMAGLSLFAVALVYYVIVVLAIGA